MYNKDDFNIKKCQFEPIQGNFIRKTEVYVTLRCTPMALHFALNDSPCDCYAKNLSFNIYLWNTSKLVTSSQQSILKAEHAQFSALHLNALFQPKQVVLQGISTRTAGMNMFSGYFDSWYPVSQTCFTVKPTVLHCWYHL